jgi:hypothetical protein
LKGGPMMWTSSVMDGKKQKTKWLILELKALNWAKTNSPFPRDHLNGFTWQIGWLWHHLHNYSDYKTKEIQMHKMHKQKGKMYDVFTYYTKCLKYDPSWDRVEYICHIPLENNIIKVKV